MQNKHSNFFWISFSDLMISLFFIMLVLYVLTFVKMNEEQKATKAELAKVREIQSAVNELPQKYFIYEPAYKRFSLNKQIQFDKGSSRIKNNYNEYLKKVGQSIESLITKLKTKYKNENIKYLIIIEGMASKDGYNKNDELSYQRALSLARFWSDNNIFFDPEYCELQVAGSGIGGVGRFLDKKQETKNQRFLIQIIPKIGEIN